RGPVARLLGRRTPRRSEVREATDPAHAVGSGRWQPDPDFPGGGAMTGPRSIRSSKRVDRGTET
ncbi:MAG: hypothetical protein ACK56I_19720, partial [bacterium]